MFTPTHFPMKLICFGWVWAYTFTCYAATFTALCGSHVDQRAPRCMRSSFMKNPCKSNLRRLTSIELLCRMGC